MMDDKIYVITGKGRDASISIIEDGEDKIVVYEAHDMGEHLCEGDKVRIEIFGEKNGYKQAIVSEIVDKVDRVVNLPKNDKPLYSLNYSADKLKEKFITKENLIEEEKREHYQYLQNCPYTFMKKEQVDDYIEKLNNCNTWEEMAELYNKRPILCEYR